jgi:hypothetical protein
MSGYLSDIDKSLDRFDEPAAKLFELNRMERHARNGVRLRVDPHSDYHQMRVRAIAIWRLHRQL